MKEQMKKFGHWAKDNAGDIAVFGTYAVVGIGLATAIVISVINQEKRYAEEIASAEADKKTMRDAIGRGASVLPAPDGGYWIIENQK